MNAPLEKYLSDVLVADRLREAERFRRSRQTDAKQRDTYESVTVRVARPVDADAVLRLSQLEGRHMPGHPILIADVGGSVLAALSLNDGASVADPFRPTGHLTELLELRARHLRSTARGRSGLWRRSPGLWLKSVARRLRQA
jgi:hypothetical protein